MKYFVIIVGVIVWNINGIVSSTGNDEELNGVLQSILIPAQMTQNNLDEYLRYELAEKMVEEKDEEVKERIFKRMRDKIQVLVDLRAAIENGGIERRSSTPFHKCCGIETHKWSSIHGAEVNANEWCLDGDVLNEGSEFDYLTEDVMAEFVKKYKEWEGIAKYIYYATEEGVMFNIPALKFCGSFDPRLRPWYVEAAAPKSKDVIIMLDLSHSMTQLVPGTEKSYLWLAKNAATTVIDILNPKDRVTIVAFNSRAAIPDAPHDSYCEGHLLNLTVSNKRHLKSFVDVLHDTGYETSYVVAFRTAFDVFQRSPLANDDRDRAILMLTDGRPDHDNITDIYNTIREGNARMGNSVVIFTFGIGPGATEAEEILKNISRQEFASDSETVKAGPYARVEDAHNIRLKMAQFSDFYKIGESTTNVAFLTPYLDAWKTGMQVPMCVQVQKQHALHGLMCIDTAMSDTFNTLPSYGDGSAKSYAFVIDEGMKTMIHPLLPHPNEISNDLIRVPIESLEVSLTPHLERITSEDTGEIELQSRIVRGMGNVDWEGVRYETQTSKYRWFALKEGDDDTGYTMVTVNPVQFESRQARWTATEIPECIYHKDNALCTRHLENRYVSNGSVFHFTSDAFMDYKDYRERDSLLPSICRYLTKGTRNEYFKDDIRDVYQSGASLDSILSSHELNSDILYYQLVTNAGVHRVYPGMTLPDNYNPYEEAWYQRCKNSNGKVTIGLPVENPFGFDQHGISICQPLFYDSEAPNKDFYGVFNVVIKVDAFWEMITEKVSECSDLHGCFLVNDAGQIVLHSDWFQHSLGVVEPLHIMKDEPYIARQIRHLSEIQECIAVTSKGGPKLQKSWRLQLPTESRSFTGFTVEGIPQTNVFIVKKKQALDDDPCYCGTRSETDECSENIDNDCFCPCHKISLNGYDPCTGDFSFNSDSPVPCIPETRRFDFSDVIELDMTTKELCVIATAERKKTKDKEGQDNTPIIASVVVVLTVAIIVGTITAIYCYNKRTREDDIYVDMVIPSNLYEAGTGVTCKPSGEVSGGATSNSSGFTQDQGSLDEQRNEAPVCHDEGTDAAPIPCERTLQPRHSSSGIYLTQPSGELRQQQAKTVGAANNDVTTLHHVQDSGSTLDKQRASEGNLVATDLSIKRDSTLTGSEPLFPTRSSQIPLTSGDLLPPVPSPGLTDNAGSNGGNDGYLTTASLLVINTNPAYENDSLSTINDGNKGGNSFTEV